MKLPVKWIAGGVAVALLATGVLHTLSSRDAAKLALQAQQASQKQQAAVELNAGDVL